jgi:RNA polymerase sigma-70 factor (ECF subfamily)
LAKTFIDIRGIIDGDPEVFRKVYLRYFDMLYHLCFEYTQNAHIAEEIVQDTFMKLWEVRKVIHKESNLGNFLYTIAKNKCLNHLREQQTLLTAQKDRDFLEKQFNIDALVETGDQWIQFEDLKVFLESVIEKMPEGIRSVFVMSRFEDKKYKEIAQLLNISIKTVESRISKALLILRKAYDDYNSEGL